MSKDERKEMIENIAERFTQMDDVDKSYIAGYMAGYKMPMVRMCGEAH